MKTLSVCEEFPHREIGWESLCFVLCLFIYLLFIYSYIYFLFTLRELFKSCISSVKVCSDFSEIALPHFVVCGFAAECDEQLTFLFNCC